MQGLRLLALLLITSVGSAEVRQQAEDHFRASLVVFEQGREKRDELLEWTSPVFVEYENGTIIWRKEWRPSIEALSVSRCESTRKQLHEIKSALRPYLGMTFELTGFSDPKVTRVWMDGKVLEIHGNWEQAEHVTPGVLDANVAAEVNKRERERWDSFPKEIRMALRSLKGFQSACEERWRPHMIMVTLFGPSHSELTPITWPDNWPRGFSEVKYIKGAKKISLPGTMLEDVIKRVTHKGRVHPISLAGEVRWLRLDIVFPGGVQRYADD